MVWSGMPYSGRSTARSRVTMNLRRRGRGYRVLGDAFIDLGLKLQLNGVDTHELMTYARELQKMGEG